MKKILFLVNPISGNGTQRIISQLIDKEIDKTKFEAHIYHTQYAKHAINIGKELCNDYHYIVAVGGDGSANETAQGLIGQETSLGIIPFGSGNGLARHLGIPLAANKALQRLAFEQTKKIDTLHIGQHPVLNVAGVGFDAHIAHAFAQNHTRGFAAYIQLTLREYWRYQAQSYQITIDGQTHTHQALMVSIANSSQFGNNAYIAPQAKIDDGQIDIAVIEPFPSHYAPILGTRLFMGNIQHSPYYHSYRGSEIKIKTNKPLLGHIDGEPILFDEEIKITIQAKSLNVLI